MQCFLHEETTCIVSLDFCQNKNQKISNFCFSLFFVYNSYSQDTEDKVSRKQKVCRCGAGVEATPDTCDTPGFPLRTEPKLVRDLQGFDRLELPRNLVGLWQVQDDLYKDGEPTVIYKFFYINAILCILT